MPLRMTRESDLREGAAAERIRSKIRMSFQAVLRSSDFFLSKMTNDGGI